jgi:hypothetical protein
MARSLAGDGRRRPLLAIAGRAARQILRRAIELSEWRLDLNEHAVSLANDGHAVALGPSADEAGDGLLFPPSARKQPCGSRPAPSAPELALETATGE